MNKLLHTEKTPLSTIRAEIIMSKTQEVLDSELGFWESVKREIHIALLTGKQCPWALKTLTNGDKTEDEHTRVHRLCLNTLSTHIWENSTNTQKARNRSTPDRVGELKREYFLILFYCIVYFSLILSYQSFVLSCMCVLQLSVVALGFLFVCLVAGDFLAYELGGLRICICFLCIFLVSFPSVSVFCPILMLVVLFCLATFYFIIIH